MKPTTIVINFAGIVLCAVLTTCNKTNNLIVNPQPDSNLLTNSSFEYPGYQSIYGWTISDYDTSAFHYLHDTPPGGGVYSINIKNRWPNSPITLVQFVRAPQGSHIYRLSVWAKDYFGGGQVSWGIKTSTTFIVVGSITVSDTVWSYYAILDTVPTTTSDSLGVSVIGGYLQPADSGASTTFDLCKLEKLH